MRRRTSSYVAGEAAGGPSASAQSSAVAIVFGVLTTESIEQAIERAGTKAGNKGWDAAGHGHVEMVSSSGGHWTTRASELARSGPRDRAHERAS